VITSWRIVKARRAETAFDGEGARLSGGRWNSPGTGMVYTSASAALAVLEILVHLGQGDILPSYVLIACSFAESIVEQVNPDDLPPNWLAYPAPPGLQSVGDHWVSSALSAVLRVPSVIVPREFNFLLNPTHADFRRVTFETPEPFNLDLRLLKASTISST
jgi:RES domain-containing protein